MRRASHNGVHELRCAGARLLLANTRVGAENAASPYIDLAPRKPPAPGKASKRPPKKASGSEVFTSAAAFKAAVERAAKAVGKKGKKVGVCRRS